MILESAAILAIAFIISLYIPGIERKVQARIQQRYGPPITTPGLWSIIKFCYKKERDMDSPNPGLYNLVLAVGFVTTCFILLFSTHYWAGVLGFASLLGIAGLLKIEEATYLFMGFWRVWSNSIRSRTTCSIVRCWYRGSVGWR